MKENIRKDVFEDMLDTCRDDRDYLKSIVQDHVRALPNSTVLRDMKAIFPTTDFEGWTWDSMLQEAEQTLFENLAADREIMMKFIDGYVGEMSKEALEQYAKDHFPPDEEDDTPGPTGP